ncbi:tRNA methyltransferase 1 homolog (S. cerevisiae)-like [Nesidiocoris tenuis]|uniref:tRNA methyltransferase 1 homolog (S. cerevisiae)-like n=1 Tax=Nesidiocoris tenuis TaxID=355587 RepID=A0ABN7AMN7_9HEMI|nr:tRNA methyltransferase 1 homolog (S. cerevisiae)-like [Nesidiocoris tenuis]
MYLSRSLVLAVLEEYVESGLSKSKPARCLDLLAGPGINGLLWAKRLARRVEVILNCSKASAEIVERNLQRNSLVAEIETKDPCALLHERGYNFVYIDCVGEGCIYFDAVFRNLARNGVVIFTGKDDSLLHGGSYDAAMRKYGGRIIRTHYARELGIRLFLGALARAAIRYNKMINVLFCTIHKNSFTVAVMAEKGCDSVDQYMNKLRLLKHCNVCEERAFYPFHNGFPVDGKSVNLGCDCALNNKPNNAMEISGAATVAESSHELGPLWAGDIFDASFIEKLIDNKRSDDPKVVYTLKCMLEEARCVSNGNVKISAGSPPFYYNLHKHHPKIAQQCKLSKVIVLLRNLGYRASSTHFDPLAVRTDARAKIICQIMESEAKKSADKMDTF